jgi:transcriptional regulator with XRE-family HTH domain
MRSNLQHPVAILRSFLGLTQKEFAEIAKCATSTVQAIELFKLKLAESRAQTISKATGCSLKWLLANDISAPMRNLRGDLYTPNDFDDARIAIQAGGRQDLVNGRKVVETEFVIDCSRLAKTLVAACETEDYPRWRYRMEFVLEQFENEFMSQAGRLASLAAKSERWSPKLRAALKADENSPHSKIAYAQPKPAEGQPVFPSLAVVQQTLAEALETVHGALPVRHKKKKAKPGVKKH